VLGNRKETNIYKSIIASLPYGLLVLDKELKVIHCNQSFETLLSKAKGEILGCELSEIIPHRELQRQTEAVIQNGGTKLVELHIDTEYLKILKAVIVALNMEDRSNVCLITLEDISERARLEGQLVQSEKIAGMGLLAATIAHELGNPLSIMSSTLQYIRDIFSDAEKQQLKEAAQAAGIIEAIEAIMDSIGRMHELLRALSDFTGSQRSHFAAADLHRLLSETLTFIRSGAEALEIKVHYEFGDDIPKCYMDARQIKQLFLNLLKNAMEAMPDGGILDVRMLLDKGKDVVRVDISDTGNGFDETELRSIFRPFYSTKPDGTGLGLTFCRRVVEEHGGEISVKSELHKGSTFSVSLPVDQERPHT